MRLAIAGLMVAGLAMAAPQQAKKAAAGAPAAVPAKRMEVPAGAVEREPGVYAFTDQAGKKWLYMRTPFGVTRKEDKPDATRPQAVDPLAYAKVTVTGDTVTFERPSPFGVYKWQKKMSELDEQEKAAVRRAQENKSGAPESSTKQEE